jgi:hypothetical protein
MALAAVRHAGQKPNSSRYSQHQEWPVFDLIRQFSECIATKALSFVRDRLAHTSRTFSYAAHDAIQSVVDELTNVIGDARRFAFRRTRQTAKPLLKVTYEVLDRCHFFRSHGFCTRGHFAPETVDFFDSKPSWKRSPEQNVPSDRTAYSGSAFLAFSAVVGATVEAARRLNLLRSV